jgi:hypothetical protein
MVSRKSSTDKTKKLKVKKETLKNLDANKKAKDVKGGRAGNEEGGATRIASCGHTFGMLCC